MDRIIIDRLPLMQFISTFAFVHLIAVDLFTALFLSYETTDDQKQRKRLYSDNKKFISYSFISFYNRLKWFVEEPIYFNNM